MITINYGKVICTRENPMVLLNDIKKMLKEEKMTWIKDSIGWKSVESIEKNLPNLTP
jgi:hypothetical protein